MEKICLTWGWTGWHITPLLAIYKELWKDYDFFWIGENDSLEKKIAQKNNIKFFWISAWKLRRYFSFKTLFEPFKIIYWIGQSFFILFKNKPKLIISKWWYVSLPVWIAAKFLWIQLFLHESDTVPGLANRLVGKFASRVYLWFEWASNFFDKKKIKVVGQILSPELIGIENNGIINNWELVVNNNVISNEFLKNSEKSSLASIIKSNSSRHCEERINPETLTSVIPENSENLSGIQETWFSNLDSRFHGNDKNEISQKIPSIDHHEVLQTSRNDEPKTNLLIIAWSQWSSRIFSEILNIIEDLSDFEITVILWTLNLKYKKDFEKYNNVEVLEFVDARKMWEILANTDIAITRAWATSLAELEYFQVKMIIIPLTESANNHQYFNARFFQGKWEIMIEEKNLSDLKNEVLKLSWYKKQNFKNKWNLALEVIREDIDSF